MVTEAHLGHQDDIFIPIEEIDPSVIVLGHDQDHDETAIKQALADRGIDVEIKRASAREPAYTGELLSSGDIIKRILRTRSAADTGQQSVETD